MEEILHQLVVYPMIYKAFYMPGGAQYERDFDLAVIPWWFSAEFVGVWEVSI